jgi:hypothetical protein
MKHGALGPPAARSWVWLTLVVGLALLAGGCQSKEPPPSQAAQAFKIAVLGELNKLTAALAAPLAHQDWEAVPPILQASYEKMTQSGRVLPTSLVVLDRNGITQGRFPSRQTERLDFMAYDMAKAVFAEKKKVHARLYLGGSKIFVVVAPVLQQDQVTGAVAMGFSEEALRKDKISEKDFFGLNFNN